MCRRGGDGGSVKWRDGAGDYRCPVYTISLEWRTWHRRDFCVKQQNLANRRAGKQAAGGMIAVNKLGDWHLWA